MKKQNLKLLKHIAITLLFPALAVQFYSGGTGAGKCLSFDGVNDYVRINNSSAFNITTGSTYSAWIKVNSYPPAGTNTYFVNKWVGGAEDKTLGITANGNVNYYLYNVFGGTGLFSTPLTIGVWYHITGTYDQNTNTATIYINGIFNISKSTSGNVSNNTGNLYIGHNQTRSDSRVLNGQIDEVRIWNRALTQTEIRNNMCKKLKGNESGLVGYWRFDEGSGNTVYDASGNGNNGTLY